MSEVAQSCPTLCDPMDYIVHQAPPSSRQEYWSGLPFPSPGNLPDPGIESKSPASPELAGRVFTTEPPGNSIWVCVDNVFLNIKDSAL